MQASATKALVSANLYPDSSKSRSAVRGREPAVLAEVYQENANIAIWQRELSDDLKACAGAVLASKHGCEISMRVTPHDTATRIDEALHNPLTGALSREIAELVDMFCCLFGLKYAGLRLTALTRAMCPRFHVDKVPCRLVTTYAGAATEWLPHVCVDRSKLGAGSQGRPDSESGLYSSKSEIEQLSIGDVALLKGELWEGNETGGLVHRSPAVLAGESRLLLTLDMIS